MKRCNASVVFEQRTHIGRRPSVIKSPAGPESLEYLTAHPDGFRYTVFCDRYRAWSKRRSPVMRQMHVAGDKLFRRLLTALMWFEDAERTRRRNPFGPRE